jgi:NACHT domain
MTGLEPLALKVAEEAAKSIAGIFIKSAWDGGGGLLNRMNLSQNIQQAVFNASRKYVDNYAERHGNLKVLGMREPVKLEDVYTGVQFLGEEGVRQFESRDNLEKAFRQSRNRRFQSEKCEKQDGLEVANTKKYLMVLGQPGAGKSTFLRRMGLEALKGKKSEYQHPCIPVFLELKRFITSSIDIEKAIIQELENCGFPKAEESTKKLLNKGNLLILFDGLDEIPTQYLDKAITTIQDFVDKHDQNRFIASCRTAAYRSSFRRFSDVIMADFDDEQIKQFITNWFQSEEDKRLSTATRCWELLQKSEYVATKELAQTPILLTLLCLVFDDSQTFPKNRAVLYGDALNVLLKRWASEKRVQREPIYKDLSLALEEMMLAEIASHNFVENRLFFSQNEVKKQISKFLADNLNAPKHLDAGIILEAIQIQQGILVERAADVLSFSHLTLQEYLTAQYIVDNNEIEGLVKNELANTRWHEVFLLVAGLMRGGTDQLLLLMESEARKYINTPKLQALLRWADDETAGSAGDMKPYGKSALAIGIADTYSKLYIRAFGARAKGIPTYGAEGIPGYAFLIANAKTLANTYFNAYKGPSIAGFIESARYLEGMKIFTNINLTTLIAQLEALEAQIPDDEQPPEMHELFGKSLIQTWLHAFNLTSEMVNLSREEITAWDNYLYANNLIIQCKDAAVRVSPQVWEKIEARMLKVK